MIFKHAKAELSLIDHGNLSDLMKSKDAPRDMIQRLGSMTPVANYLDDYVYIRHRAISAREHYGPNGNHDSFPQKDLQKAASTFISTGFYKDHNNHDKSLAYGINLDAYYHPKHFVVLLTAVSKKFKPDSPEMVANIIANKWNQTSMGAAVGWSECSVCANKAHTPEEYCNHIRFAKGQLLEGKLVEEINHDFEFFEDSLITTEAADRDARIAEIYLPEDMLKAASLQQDVLKGDFTDFIRMPHVRMARMINDLKSARDRNSDTTNAPILGETDNSVAVLGGNVSGLNNKVAESPKRSGEEAVGLPANAPQIAATDIKDMNRVEPKAPLLKGTAPKADGTNTADPERVTQVKDNVDYAIAAKALAQAASALEGLSKSSDTIDPVGNSAAGTQMEAPVAGTPEEIAAEAAKKDKDKAKEKKDKDLKKKKMKKGALGVLTSLIRNAIGEGESDDGSEVAFIDIDLDPADFSSEVDSGGDEPGTAGSSSDLKQLLDEVRVGMDMLDTEKDVHLAAKRKATSAFMTKRAEQSLVEVQNKETSLMEAKHEIEEMLKGVKEGDTPDSKTLQKLTEEVRELLKQEVADSGLDSEGRLKAMALAYIPSFVGRKIKADSKDKGPGGMSGGEEKPKDGNMQQMVDRGDYDRPKDPWAAWKSTFDKQDSSTQSEIVKQRGTGFATPEEQIKQRKELESESRLSEKGKKLVTDAKAAYIKLRTGGKSHDEAVLTISANLTRIGVGRRRAKKVKKASGLETSIAKKRRSRTKKAKASLSAKTLRLKAALMSRYEQIRSMGATHDQALLIVQKDIASLGVKRRRAKKAVAAAFPSTAKKRTKRTKKVKKMTSQERTFLIRQNANQKYELLRKAGVPHERALEVVKADLIKATAEGATMSAPASPPMGLAPGMGDGLGLGDESGMGEVPGAKDAAWATISDKVSDAIVNTLFESNPNTPDNQAGAADVGMPPSSDFGASQSAAAFGVPPVSIGSSLRQGRPSMNNGFEAQSDLQPSGEGAGTIQSDESAAPSKNFSDDPSDKSWDLFPEDQISAVVRESNSEQEAQLKQDLKGVYVPAPVAQRKQISPRAVYPNAAREAQAGRSTEDLDGRALLSLQLAQSEVDAGLVPQADLEQEAQRLFRMNPDQLKGVESTLQKVASRRFPHPDSRKDIVTQAMTFSSGFGGAEVEVEENLFDE